MNEETPPADISKQSGWLGKSGCFVTVIAVIGAIVGIITGVIKIIEFANARSSKVTAEVSLAAFSVPPALVRDREKLETFTAKPETLEQALDLPKCDASDKSTIARNITRFLRDTLPFTAGGRFFDPTEVWFADVKNNSESTCEGVTLTLPGTNSVAIQREGKAVEYLDINEVLDIGDLKPKELVKITGWAHGFVDEDKLKLVYKTGVGNVKLTKPLSADWQLVSELWSGCALELFMFLFLLIIGAIAVRRIISRRKAAPEAQ
jgi:hypothetical protein